jgi:phosphotransferase system enzyme I (PtsI)
MIAIDGDSVKIFCNLSEEEREEFINRMLAEQEKKKLLKELAKESAETKDGVLLELYGNIGMPEEVDKILEYGGTGIGLFRSEYLYLTSDTLPSEKQQFLAYKKSLEGMGTKPTIVRTLDIGGDKDVPALALEKEENPFLGLRAIRLCQKREAVFRAQLRALLRASVYGNLHIMFPMISSLEELKWAKEQLELCKEELRNEKVEYADKIPVGMMVEIPSVAIMADVFAKYCDFFSIGTNDLTQYTLAVDRGNEAVSELFSYFHPSVIRMIKAVIEGAHQRGIPCGMCGEAAGDPKMIPLLIGMGLDEYSMTASSLPKVKAIIRKLDSKDCVSLLEQVLDMETTKEVEMIVNQFINEKEIDLC